LFIDGDARPVKYMYSPAPHESYGLAQAGGQRRRPSRLVETFMGGFGRHRYLDILSQSLKPPRDAEIGAIGRLRRPAGRVWWADAVEERGSDTQATRWRGRGRGRAETFMGGFGPDMSLDIVSRSLRPPR